MLTDQPTMRIHQAQRSNKAQDDSLKHAGNIAHSICDTCDMARSIQTYRAVRTESESLC